MSDFKIRPAERADLERILEIYACARQFMAQNGNPTQWGNGYPKREMLEEDIRRGRLYAVTGEQTIHGVFYFVIGPDPTYEDIDGAWHSDGTYGTIHRIAADGIGGIFKTCLEYCRSRCDYLRVDTHEKNKPMQHQVEKYGFRRCGIIHVEDGSPRIAYDLI